MSRAAYRRVGGGGLSAAQQAAEQRAAELKRDDIVMRRVSEKRKLLRTVGRRLVGAGAAREQSLRVAIVGLVPSELGCYNALHVSS